MITTASPASTFCPTLASTLNTLPAAPALTWMLPAPAALAGAAAGAATGAAATGESGSEPSDYRRTEKRYTIVCD